MLSLASVYFITLFIAITGAAALSALVGACVAPRRQTRSAADAVPLSVRLLTVETASQLLVEPAPQSR